MSLQNRSLSSSYVSSDCEERCGGGQRSRLTAVEELRGHLSDCLSLYASRFHHADFSLSCICKWNSTTSDLASAVGTARAEKNHVSQPPSAGASVFSGSIGWNEDASAFDTSTAATILFLRDGPKGTTHDVPLGVVVSFQYYAGFVVCAERQFPSLAETNKEIKRLSKGGAWSLEKLVRGNHGWTAVAADAGSESKCGTEPQPELDEQARLCETVETTSAYESLMSLLVHRYL